MDVKSGRDWVAKIRRLIAPCDPNVRDEDTRVTLAMLARALDALEELEDLRFADEDAGAEARNLARNARFDIDELARGGRATG